MAGSFRTSALLLALLSGFLCPGVAADPVETCRLLLSAKATALIDSDAVYEAAMSPEVASIYDACPIQVDALAQHPWGSLLARGPRELTFSDLQGFYHTYQHYAAIEPVPVLDSSSVHDALARLDIPPPEPLSLWQRFAHWFSQWWGDDRTAQFDWLEDLRVSESLVTAIFYVSLVLIVLLAVGIIIAELRAGLSPRRRVSDSGWEEQDRPQSATLTLDQLSAAPLREQPGLLLALVLARLQAAGVLDLRASLTHRDISAAAAQLDQGESVGLLSGAAERATFGGWTPCPQDMELLLQTGQRIVQMLEQRTA